MFARKTSRERRIAADSSGRKLWKTFNSVRMVLRVFRSSL